MFVACSDNYHSTLQFPSAQCFSIFQLIVLVLQPTTCVCLTAIHQVARNMAPNES